MPQMPIIKEESLNNVNWKGLEDKNEQIMSRSKDEIPLNNDGNNKQFNSLRQF